MNGIDLHFLPSRIAQVSGISRNDEARLTAGGMDSSGKWVPSVYYDVDALTHYWRKGVIRLLRASLRIGLLQVQDVAGDIESELVKQEGRWWSVKVQSLGAKEHFLRYAGRYARRPPIAQRRIIGITK